MGNVTPQPRRLFLCRLRQRRAFVDGLIVVVTEQAQEIERLRTIDAARSDLLAERTAERDRARAMVAGMVEQEDEG